MRERRGSTFLDFKDGARARGRGSAAASDTIYARESSAMCGETVQYYRKGLSSVALSCQTAPRGSAAAPDTVYARESSAMCGGTVPYYRRGLSSPELPDSPA